MPELPLSPCSLSGNGIARGPVGPQEDGGLGARLRQRGFCTALRLSGGPRFAQWGRFAPQPSLGIALLSVDLRSVLLDLQQPLSQR